MRGDKGDKGDKVDKGGRGQGAEVEKLLNFVGASLSCGGVSLAVGYE
ncbi:MAG: hypothetical protein ACRAVC_07755 [Trichormus sp.]